MRVALHVGLAVLLVLAPALCCCNIASLGGDATASASASLPCPSCPESPAPASPPVKVPACASCCHEEEEDAAPATQAPAEHRAPAPTRCKCCVERPDAARTDLAPTVAAPEPTGELLLVALLAPAAVAPEHLGLLRGLDPPERAGVDALYEALFARHVLRC
jgi:hypothetical protein